VIVTTEYVDIPVGSGVMRVFVAEAADQAFGGDGPLLSSDLLRGEMPIGTNCGQVFVAL
jgi:hypothetical protein